MMETNEPTLERSDKSYLGSHTRATSRAKVSSFRSRTGKAGAGINLESGNSGHSNEGEDYDTSKQKIRPLLARVTEPLTRLLSLIRSGKQLSFRNSVHLCCNWVLRNPQLLWILAVVWCMISFHRFCVYKYTRLFGGHPMEGGRYGRWIDETIVQWVLADNYEKRRQELEDIGVELPDFRHLKEVLTINTNAALREVLVRRQARGNRLSTGEIWADTYEKSCLSRADNPSHGQLSLVFDARQSQNFTRNGIPWAVHSPRVTSWLLPRPGVVSSGNLLVSTESEMLDVIEQFCPKLLTTYTSLVSLKERVHLWSICTIYTYGGVFIGNRSAIAGNILKDLLLLQPDDETSPTPESAISCTPPFGITVFEAMAPFHQKNHIGLEISVLAATPRHPHLLCVINQLETFRHINGSSILETLFLMTDSWKSSLSYKSLQDLSSMGGNWDKLSTSLVDPCRPNGVDAVNRVPWNVESDRKASQMFVRVEIGSEKNPRYDDKVLARSRVAIKEQRLTISPLSQATKKVSLESQMKEKWIEPGWLCSRCLKASIFGTFEKCAFVCPTGYEDIMCHNHGGSSKINVTIDVELTITSPSGTLVQDTRRIPKIIHQTWHSPVDADRYPQLKRLQNSWLTSGWEYRFYTDEDARAFIAENYPERFVRAFDSVIPGAYKADLFRYLVLLKDGGIYADVDILLDSNLDHFVTPDLSFFVPRDMVGEYADEAFCLWNGFIGSSPGHPFLVRAVERLVNLISRRADLYDMEQDLCRRQGRKTETWKVRAEPLLLFSGPCALGAAVNDVLGRPSLNRFDIGWLPSDDSGEDYGDALVLVGDKFDLGAFRFSDPESGLIVASTDLPGVSKEPREDAYLKRRDERTQKVRRQVLPHYSSTASGHAVWGTHNVYIDDLVINEEIRLAHSVRYEEQDSGPVTEILDW